MTVFLFCSGASFSLWWHYTSGDKEIQKGKRQRRGKEISVKSHKVNIIFKYKYVRNIIMYMFFLISLCWMAEFRLMLQYQRRFHFFCRNFSLLSFGEEAEEEEEMANQVSQVLDYWANIKTNRHTLKNITKQLNESLTIVVFPQTFKGKSKSSHDLLKDDPRLSSVPAVNKCVLMTN